MLHLSKIASCVALLTLLFVVPASAGNNDALNSIAEEYVKLVLAVGQFHPDYIDAYFGPSEWRPAPPSDSTGAFPYEQFHRRAVDLLSRLSGMDVNSLNSSQILRYHHMQKLVLAAKTMVDIIHGNKLSFDEESEGLYDAVLPHHDSRYYDSAMSSLDHILPGTGDIAARYIAYADRFNVPPGRLDTLVRLAINECRIRTKRYLSLPDSERFLVEFVDHRSWGAYNWYQGNLVSLIQIDTTRAITLPSLIGIAAHEGYPGHHVYSVLTDRNLCRDSGWLEYCVQPLFDPASLVCEGTAIYALDLIFPRDERKQYLKTVLFPLAGFESSEVDRYLEVAELSKTMREAWAEAARAFLDGRFSREQTITWLTRYAGSDREKAENAIEFFDQYRSYAITYVVGESLVRNYVEGNRGKNNKETRWERFLRIIESPLTASDLMSQSFGHEEPATGGTSHER